VQVQTVQVQTRCRGADVQVHIGAEVHVQRCILVQVCKCPSMQVSRGGGADAEVPRRCRCRCRSAADVQRCRELLVQVQTRWCMVRVQQDAEVQHRKCRWRVAELVQCCKGAELVQRCSGACAGDQVMRCCRGDEGAECRGAEDQWCRCRRVQVMRFRVADLQVHRGSGAHSCRGAECRGAGAGAEMQEGCSQRCREPDDVQWCTCAQVVQVQWCTRDGAEDMQRYRGRDAKL
jgi:hypothetical protein